MKFASRKSYVVINASEFEVIIGEEFPLCIGKTETNVFGNDHITASTPATVCCDGDRTEMNVPCLVTTYDE